MGKKNTDELENELARSKSLRLFLHENERDFRNETFSHMLQELFQETQLSKAELAKRSGMSEVYLHQLFSGRRKPSRERVLCLCIGLGTDIDTCQELLRRCGYSTLYVRSRPDAIIMYGLMHHMTLFEINDRLFDEGEDTLI